MPGRAWASAEAVWISELTATDWNPAQAGPAGRAGTLRPDLSGRAGSLRPARSGCASCQAAEMVLGRSCFSMILSMSP